MEQKGQTPQVDTSGIKHKIVIISGKGGVGKSTVAANLAYSFAQKAEVRVGLLDVDIHGPNIPKMLGLEEKRLNMVGERIQPVSLLPNLLVVSMAFLLPDADSPVIWRGPLKMKAIRQFLEDTDWGRLDYLVIDLPPGTGDEPLSIGQLIRGIDGAIVVTTPQEVSLLDSRKAVNFARKLGMPIMGILENMSSLVCPHCGKRIDLFKVGGGERAALELGVPFLGRIPIEPKIVESGDSGQPFVELYEDSEAAKAFAEVVKRCEDFIGSREPPQEE